MTTTCCRSTELAIRTSSCQVSSGPTASMRLAMQLWTTVIVVYWLGTQTSAFEVNGLPRRQGSRLRRAGLLGNGGLLGTGIKLDLSGLGLTKPGGLLPTLGLDLVGNKQEPAVSGPIIKENIDAILEGLLSWMLTSEQKMAIPVSRSNIFFPQASPEDQFQTCRTPYNEAGHCRPVKYCLLPQFANDYQMFLKYVCFIGVQDIGACCPDRFFSQGNRGVAVTTRPTRAPIRATTRRRGVTTARTQPPPIPFRSIENDCGIGPNTRIVGGRNSDPDDWVWMAALLRVEEDEQYCGGALVTRNYVMTAAHCVRGVKESELKIRLGEYDFSRTGDTESQDFDVAAIKMHPRFDRLTFQNDLALLKLARPATFSARIVPICLPEPGKNYVGEFATVAGWGTLSFGGPSSHILKEVSLPVWRNEECDSTFSQNITDIFLCAGSRTGKEDSCQGDSGGPLMLMGPNRRWMIIGVVSWGIRCAEPGYPGVYTRVNRFLDWVGQTMA